MYKKSLLCISKLPLYDFIDCNENFSGSSESGYHSIEYYIIENSYRIGDNKEMHKYGICISKRNDNGETEESLVKSVSDSRAEVESLISSLCVHTVTPLTLHDIMEDFKTK